MGSPRHAVRALPDRRSPIRRANLNVSNETRIDLKLEWSSAVDRHVDDSTLVAYAGQAMPSGERARVKEHLAQCAECRKAFVQHVGGSSTPFAAEVIASSNAETSRIALAAASTTCPSDDELAAHVAGDLPAAQRHRIALHLDGCDACRAVAVAVACGTPPVRRSSNVLTAATGGSADDAATKPLPKPGEKLVDRFTIIKALGQGGMGHVLEARDDDLGINIALKVLRADIAHDEEHLRHLRREILAARKIAHPNVCRVFDLGKTDKLLFITMELVTGTTLAEQVRQGAMPAGKVLDVLRQLLAGLGSAHAVGIVHRDLKPANVMLDAAGKIKVMDFGLARDLAGEHSLQGAVGTPAYWAPEQSRGEAAGPAADIYSVGILTYMLLTGEGSTRKLRAGNLDKVPSAFRAWIERCVREEPADRFPDAMTAMTALPETAGRPRRRWPAIVGAAIALTAIAAVWRFEIADSGHRAVPAGSPGTAPGSASGTDSADNAAVSPAPPVPSATPPADALAAPITFDAPIDAPIAIDAGSARHVSVTPGRIPHGHPGGTPRDAGVTTPAATPPASPDASLLYEP
jgi:hypothetical protein